MRNLICFTCLAVLATVMNAGIGWAAEVNSAMAALEHSRSTILREEIKRHAEVLADDTMEGREAGRPGGRSASIYVMRSLRKSGLKPAGLKGTCFQPFRAGCRNILAELQPTDSPAKRDSMDASVPKGAEVAFLAESGGAATGLRQVRPSQESAADEFIIVCAHYDHVGYGTRKTSNGPTGYIHNGADDNASGVATVLEVAEALQKYPGKLKRRVLFVFWDAEEKGLWGSKHWLDHPTVPLDSVRLLVNVDMVGRLREKLSLYGTRSLPGLRWMWSKANIDNSVKLGFPWETLNNSDHYPFLERGIPITMVHTGLHDDYHTPSDDAYLLNYDGIKSATDLVLNFVVQAANAERLGQFRPEAIREKEVHQRLYEQPRSKSNRRLGITLAKTENGMRIQSVVVGALGDQFGLRPGQTILSLDGERPQTFAGFRRRLAESLDSITATIEDGSEQRDVTITFEQPKKTRLGVLWNTNDAEPNTVTVTRVFRESVADAAGLRELDRIHKVNGIRVENGEGFQAQLADSVAVELLIERDGKLRLVKFELPDDGDAE